MKDIILQKFPLIPKEIVMEIEISIHNIIGEHMVTDRMEWRFGEVPVGEFAKGERIQGYLHGIFSALYMTGFIDGAHHCNDSCIVTSMVEDFIREAEEFYRWN